MTEKQEDYIVRATAADGEIRAFAATTRGMCEEARRRHNTSPVVTAALGRLLTAGAIMGSDLKSESDLLTLQVKSDGPLRGMVVTADSQGNVKGYPQEPMVLIPANAAGKLDVGGAVGHGVLYVIRDLGLKDPYVGQTELTTGEIADDLTYYFAKSEQIPSVTGLGVLMAGNNTVKQAGGFLIQLMPDASEETLAKLEKTAEELHSVTDLLEKGMTPEDILNFVLQGLDPVIGETSTTRFHCGCDREHVSKVLAAMSPKDLREIIADGKVTELRCNFCDTTYHFAPAEIEEILEKGRKA